MSRHVSLLLLTYACLVVQTGAGDLLAWNDWKPHLVAIPVTAAVLLLEGTTAVLWAAAIGLWWDGLTGNPPGESLLLTAVIARLLQATIGSQPIRASMTIGFLTAVTAWLHGLGWRVLEAWRDSPSVSATDMLRLTSQQAIWTGFLTAAALLAVRFLIRGLGLQRRSLAPLMDNRWHMLNN